MKKKPDEENFDEAIAQAYRVWTETKVSYDVLQLFKDPALKSLSISHPSPLAPTPNPFFHLLAALKSFTE